MLVKVWNKNKFPYTEKFRDRTIVIAPNSFTEMDEDEALIFKGTFTFPRKDEQDRPDPRYFKMIDLEYPEGYEAEQENLICHANGQKAATKEDLAKIIAGFSDRIADDKEAEKAAKQNDKVAKALKKENEDLKMQMGNLEGKINKMMAVLEKLGGIDDTTA